jgi:hypothetical protein
MSAKIISVLLLAAFVATRSFTPAPTITSVAPQSVGQKQMMCTNATWHEINVLQGRFYTKHNEHKWQCERFHLDLECKKQILELKKGNLKKCG